MSENTTCDLHRYEPYGPLSSMIMLVGFCVKNSNTMKSEYCETLVGYTESQTKEDICQIARTNLNEYIELLITAVES